MDWPTILVSTALSAVVGTLVSLAAVSQTTIRQRRAERHDTARLAIRAVASHLRSDLLKYQSRMQASLRRHDPEKLHADDYQTAAKVISASEELSFLRRKLVTRRARRIFGPMFVRLAEISPPNGENTMGGLVAPLLIVGQDPSKLGLREADLRTGLLHTALTKEPGAPELRQLDKELRRLQGGW